MSGAAPGGKSICESWFSERVETMKSVKCSVTLVSHSPDPQTLLAAAAKLCYADDTEHLLEQNPATSGKFVKMLRDLGHMSPLEHAS